MKHRVTWLAAAACLCAACSSESKPSPAIVPATSTCASTLPKAIVVSEGGRASLERSGDLAGDDVTFEGRGVTVHVEQARILIRAPYRSQTSEPLAVDVRCGGAAAETVAIELSPLSWTRLAEWQDEAPAAREYAAWWIDPRGALVVYGGFHYRPKQFTPANDAWRFDFATSTWAPLAGELPLQPGGRAAPIGSERSVYYFGGTKQTADGSLDTEPSMFRLDYDDATITATRVENLGAAPGSYTGSLIHDEKRGRWLSVCGVDTRSGLNCDVHAFTAAGGFVPVTTEGRAPAGRYGFHYAYDAETDRVIVFAGQDGPDNLDIAGDTWALELASDPPKWVQLFTSDPVATKRRNGAFALDPIGHRLFVWGGTPDGKDSVKGLQVLTLDRGGEAWANVITDTDPPSRTSALAAYDHDRERIVVGFGNDDAIYRDLWSLAVANGSVTPR